MRRVLAIAFAALCFLPAALARDVPFVPRRSA